MLDFIQDVLIRQWNDLLARPSGPLSFRFVLQPVMAAIVAIRAGLAATSRIMILGIVMDAIYQFLVLKKFYPVEAFIVAFVLAVLPYFVLRGPADRIGRWWHERGLHRTGQTGQ